MLFLLIFQYWTAVPGWLAFIIKANAVIGVILAILAFIGWIGTDRSHELFEAMDEGYALNSADIRFLDMYANRSFAFGIHILLCAGLGIIGWRIGAYFIPIPSEE